MLTLTSQKQRTVSFALAIFVPWTLAGVASFHHSTSAAGLSISHSGQTSDSILARAIANEKLFSEALKGYRFHQSLVVESLAPLGGYVTGKMEREADITVEQDGRWSEWITRFPRSTLRANFAAQDLESYGAGRAFPITPENRDQFDLKYIGLEKIDDVETLAFEASPKFLAALNQKKQAGKKLETRDVGEEGRTFAGTLWIEPHEAAVVKLKGKHVPELKNRYPVYETLRQPVGQFYLPAYTFSDDTLEFERSALRLRAEISYSDFKKK